MKIFADLHHRDLFYSLKMLFEDRLGHQLYRPIGLDWYHQKYWAVYNHPATAKQYLDLNSASSIPTDIHGNKLPEHTWGNTSYLIEDNVYYVEDITHDSVDKAITFDVFKQMDFDIILASIPAHATPFKDLIKKFQPKAKFIFQTGNPGWGLPANNVLCSTGKVTVPSSKNIVFYHQELDDKFYKFKESTNHKTMYSYVHYMKKKKTCEEYQRNMKDWNIRMFGAGMGPGNCLRGAKEVAAAMIESGWTWHFKPRGDGFGHNVHGSYACGRPLVILDAKPYTNQPAGDLMEDMVTCVDLSKRTIHENVKILNRLAEPEEHTKMCAAAHNRFVDVVDYNAEEQEIRRFMDNLK